MKIGIYNIYLTVWVLFMASMGGYLCYQGIANFHFPTTVITLIFSSVFLVLIAAIIAVSLYKLKHVIVSKDSVTSFWLFRFRKTNINFNNISNLTWKHWSNRGTYFKTIEIKANDGSVIVFSDFEYENFNSIAKYITDHTKYDMPYGRLVEQAKKNKGDSIFIFWCFSALLGYIFYRGIGSFDLVRCVLLTSIIVIILTALRRWVIYLRWINYGKRMDKTLR